MTEVIRGSPGRSAPAGRGVLALVCERGVADWAGFLAERPSLIARGHLDCPPESRCPDFSIEPVPAFSAFHPGSRFRSPSWHELTAFGAKSAQRAYPLSWPFVVCFLSLTFPTVSVFVSQWQRFFSLASGFGLYPQNNPWPGASPLPRKASGWNHSDYSAMGLVIAWAGTVTGFCPRSRSRPVRMSPISPDLPSPISRLRGSFRVRCLSRIFR